jgi:putative membrane protein
MTWMTQGKSPDYRFTLANERTFLAWIRTALAFMAAAIGIDQLAPDLAPGLFRSGLVIALGLTAAGLSCYAWRRWSDNERAMRQDAALPFPRALIWLSSGLSAGVLLTLLVLVAI